jgi:ferrochelatase
MTDIPSKKRAALLVNLGSPDAPTESDVRRYLNQFLMDEYVIDKPWLLRRFVVSAFILPKRPAESAHAYQSIWQEEGSPLIIMSKKLHALVQQRSTVPVGLAMRYQNPSMESEILKLVQEHDPDEILLIPLYPHYAMSSVTTSIKEAERIFALHNLRATLKVHPAFYKDPAYITSLVNSAKALLDQDYDHLLFSYHGIPERHIRKTDPTKSHCLTTPNCCNVDSPAHEFCYRHQCYKTTELFVKEAGIPEGQYSVSFQSRLGRDPWLKPYTDFELERLAKEGVKKIVVICPAFVSDCLETIEEIGMRGKEDFETAGGESLTLIPCLNDRPDWADVVAGWINQG